MTHINIEGYDGEDYAKTKDEHCRIKGHLEVNRVSGTIHIAPGKTINMHGQARCPQHP